MSCELYKQAGVKCLGIAASVVGSLFDSGDSGIGSLC